MYSDLFQLFFSRMELMLDFTRIYKYLKLFVVVSLVSFMLSCGGGGGGGGGGGAASGPAGDGSVPPGGGGSRDEPAVETAGSDAAVLLPGNDHAGDCRNTAYFTAGGYGPAEKSAGASEEGTEGRWHR